MYYDPLNPRTAVLEQGIGMRLVISFLVGGGVGVLTGILALLSVLCNT